MARIIHTRLLSLQSHVPFKSLSVSVPPSFFTTHGCSITRVTKLLQGPTEVSSSRHVLNGFRTLCTSKDLTIKKCVPCDLKELRPMTIEAAYSLINEVPKWELVNEEGLLRLRQSWKVKSFTKGLDFFKAIAAVAEAEGHHPDLHLVGWNNVKIEIWTHAVGGLTENDFILAAKIDRLDLSPLLSRKFND